MNLEQELMMKEAPKIHELRPATRLDSKISVLYIKSLIIQKKAINHPGLNKRNKFMKINETALLNSQACFLLRKTVGPRKGHDWPAWPGLRKRQPSGYQLSSGSIRLSYRSFPRVVNLIISLTFWALLGAGFEACYAPLGKTSAAAPAEERIASPLVYPGDEKVKSLVDEWLRQLPAGNQAEAEKIFSEMLTAASPVVYELGRRLAVPGQADDSLVRYAIDGLVTLSGKPGYIKHKKFLADDLLKLAASIRADEIRKFLLEEVQYVAEPEHLARLADFLKIPDLTEYALKAMLRLKGAELENLLIDNLNRLPTESRAPVILALGKLRSRKAIPRLRILAQDSDPEIKYSALTALADIADPSTERLLASIPALSSPLERRQRLELYLRFARRLAEDGYRIRALEIAERATEIFTSAEEVSLRCEALNLVVEIAAEKTIPSIIKAIWSEQPAYRQQALKLAGQSKWPALLKELIENLAGLPPANRAAVIEFFANPEISVNDEIIETYLGDPDEIVRQAAIRTCFARKKDRAVSRLLAGLNKSETEAGLILELLKSLKPESYLPDLQATFPQLSDAGKITVLRSLQDLLNSSWKKEVLAASQSENPELKKAATECLFQVVEGNDLSWLVERYLSLPDPSSGPDFQKAIVAALSKIQNSELRQKSFLSLIGQRAGKERADLIRLLPQVGGQACLTSLIQFLNEKSPETNSAALAALSSWPDFEASPPLINLIKSSNNRTHRYLAFQGLARLMKDPAADREQKIRLLNEIKPLAVYPDEKNFLLSAWSSVRDLRSLREIACFFSDENLRERAAVLASRLARPVAGEDGLEGFETIMILKTALTLLKDDLEIEETEMYLDRLLRQEGFEPLFNRKDLYGWKGLVADPVKRANMSPEELRTAQQKADEEMKQHWKVIEGVLVFDGKGHSLCTVKDYCNFELFVDWKIESGGDSGIYLRGSPQVQIWDPAQWPEGSGGLYNNQKNPNKPLRPADNPVGTWNTFYIKMVDERVTVYLNGQLVVDNVIMENYWERDKPIYPCGQIELQAHNTPLYFKNIYLREIKKTS